MRFESERPLMVTLDDCNLLRDWAYAALDGNTNPADSDRIRLLLGKVQQQQRRLDVELQQRLGFR